MISTLETDVGIFSEAGNRRRNFFRGWKPTSENIPTSEKFPRLESTPENSADAGNDVDKKFQCRQKSPMLELILEINFDIGTNTEN
jgi:hypothetical protein